MGHGGSRKSHPANIACMLQTSLNEWLILAKKSLSGPNADLLLGGSEARTEPTASWGTFQAEPGTALAQTKPPHPTPPPCPTTHQGHHIQLSLPWHRAPARHPPRSPAPEALQQCGKSPPKKATNKQAGKVNKPRPRKQG